MVEINLKRDTDIEIAILLNCLPTVVVALDNIVLAPILWIGTLDTSNVFVLYYLGKKFIIIDGY